MRQGTQWSSPGHGFIQVDTGTFAARLSQGGPVVGVIWRSPSFPEFEVWSLNRMDAGGYVRPSEQSQMTSLWVTRLPADPTHWTAQDEKGDPTNQQDLGKFLAFAAMKVATPVVLTSFRLCEAAAPPNPAPPVTDQRGCLKPGLYEVFEPTISTSTPMAWAWHPESADDYEVWLYREPVNGSGGFETPGHHSGALEVQIQWIERARAAPDLDAFYQWVFDRHPGLAVVREHAAAVERVP